MIKEIVGHVDLDGVMANYEKAAIHGSHSKKGFFKNLEPIEGSIWAFQELSKYFDMNLLSTAPWSNVHSSSEKRIWVEEQLGELSFKKLTTTHRKDRVIGHFLIDDRTANGASEFKGEHIHIFTDPRFMTWESVVEYLINKYSNPEHQKISNKNIDMKDKIVNLVKESLSINLADISQHLFIKVSEARKYAEDAISEKLIKFDEEKNFYYYDFVNEKELHNLNDLR
jgi:5'-nucleotidase